MVDRASKVEGLKVEREEVEILHLQFANDSVFFLYKVEHNLGTLLMMVESYCVFSGLKINRAKCCIAGINTQEGRAELFAYNMRCGLKR